MNNQSSEDITLFTINKKLLLDFIDKDLEIMNPRDVDARHFLLSYRDFVASLPMTLYKIENHTPNEIVFTHGTDEVYRLSLNIKAIGGYVYTLTNNHNITEVQIVQRHNHWIQTLIEDAIDDYLIPDTELKSAINQLDKP